MGSRSTGLFRDRAEAGRHLGERLTAFRGRPDLLVLGLPRGGVPVAFEVAVVLDAPLDVYLVRKLGVPGHEELAMGAIATGGGRVLNREVVSGLGIDEATIAAETEAERRELERREQAYRDGGPAPSLAGRTIILVDDGLATGASMRAALAAARAAEPAWIVVAVPVAPPTTCAALRDAADNVVCLQTPEPFGGVGLWYQTFDQVPDEEIRRLLARSRRVSAPGRSATQ